MPDLRIGFYAERRWAVSPRHKKGNYVVQILQKDQGEKKQKQENWQRVHSLVLGKESELVIYKVTM